VSGLVWQVKTPSRETPQNNNATREWRIAVFATATACLPPFVAQSCLTLLSHGAEATRFFVTTLLIFAESLPDFKGLQAGKRERERERKKENRAIHAMFSHFPYFSNFSYPASLHLSMIGCTVLF